MYNPSNPSWTVSRHPGILVVKAARRHYLITFLSANGYQKVFLAVEPLNLLGFVKRRYRAPVASIPRVLN